MTDEKPSPLIAGNWKMNGLRAQGLALVKAIRAGAGGCVAELLVCPPATLVALAGDELRGGPVALGGPAIQPPAGRIPATSQPRCWRISAAAT